MNHGITPEHRSPSNGIRIHSQRGIRKWGLRLLALIMSLVPFLAAEILLRVLQPLPKEAVDSSPWIDLQQLKPLFVKNLEGSRWEIPPSRLNFFCRDSFAATKSESTRRIFVLGGSTVQGRPYATETAFPTWLRIKLEVAAPDTNYEVINCGGVSYASYRVEKILEEVLTHQPDAVVVYTGHNEFLEDREYSQAREFGPLRGSLVQAIRHIRLATWLREQFSKPTTSTPVNHLMPQEVATRLDQAEGLASYQRDPQWQRKVEQHFAVTLQNMIKMTKESKIPLVLCVPESDLVKTPPFKTTPVPSLTEGKFNQFETFWKRAKNPDLQNQERLSAARSCLQIDPQHAGAHYLTGRILYDQGDSERAISHLTQARDQDVCPLRATSAIVAAVRTASDQRHVILVDIPKAFDEKNTNDLDHADNIPDPAWFLDHVHPTIKGHQVIADRCFEAMRVLPWVKQPSDESIYRSKITNHLSSLDEAYFARGKQRLEGLRRWTKGRASLPLPINTSER